MSASCNEEPEVDVLIGPGAFDPQEFIITVGSTVIWYNQDTVTHTVTAGDQTFDSGNLMPGATFSYTFEEPGTYSYHCTLHPDMTGAVTVE